MSRPAPPVVSTRGLSKQFGHARALAGVDLTLEAGQFLTLFGPNGAGKTTLVRILATLARPTGGEARLFGVDLTTADAGLRRRIGVVSHQGFLYEALSAWQNLGFYARMYDVDDADERIARGLRAVGLDGRMHDPVGTFSRGMVQRCAIARALLHEPDLLLLDEPFSGLDPEASDRLRELLAGVRDGRRTVLLTSHDIGRGAELADRVAFLASGRLVHEGPRDGLDAAALRALYRPRRRAPGGRP